MSIAEIMSEDERLPIVPYLTRGSDGTPGFAGTQCRACETIHTGTIRVCPRCGERDQLEPRALGTTGTLYNYTIVYRSVPGVKTPFISAIIDLDGGGSIKANLDVPDESVCFDMPVKAVFEDLDQVDAKGRHYHGFHFVPAGEPIHA